MKKIFVSLTASTILFSAGDPQSIVSEVTKLRQKYEECKAHQPIVKGIDPKVHKESQEKIQALSREIAQKEGVMRSLEQTLSSRDRAYREMAVRNKSLIQQIHSDKVSRQERESLKRAVMNAKAELVLAQKELKGGSTSVNQTRQELEKAKATILSLKSQMAAVSKQTNPVTKVVEPTEKLKALQSQLLQAQATIVELRNRNNSTKNVVTEKIVEKVVYRDKPIVQQKIVEKIVTKVVEPTEKLKSLQKELAQAQAVIANMKNSTGVKTVVKEKIVEKVVYKDRPVEKVVEKVVYKDKPVVQQKIVEKVVTKKVVDEDAQRKIDKLALELERARSSRAKATHVTAPEVQKTVIPPKAAAAVVATSTPSPKKSGNSSAYRMATDAPIYNAPNGSQVTTWEARRSFTAGNPSGGWVHITGYFVNRVWQSTAEGENLYVKESDTIRR